MRFRRSLTFVAFALAGAAVPATALAQSTPVSSTPTGVTVTTKANKGEKARDTKTVRLSAKCQAYQAKVAEASAKVTAAQGAVQQLQSERAAAVAANRTKVVAKIDQRLPKAQTAVTKAQQLLAKVNATDHCATPPQKASGPKSGGAAPTTTAPVTTAPASTVPATTTPAA